MIQPERNIPIAQFTNYKIGGTAREVYFPADAKDFLKLLRTFQKDGTNYYILGGGSNVLVGDRYFDGDVIITTHMNKYKTFNDHIVCGAGLPSSKVAEIALENSRTGLEFLYLLPGSIGGSVAGNARYDDINVSSVLISLIAVHPDKGMKTFRADEIDFDYKYTSILYEGWYICDVSMKWENGDPTAIKKIMDEIEKARGDAHHFEFPSSGCIFKNDHKNNIQAGRLIDSLGLKGLEVGGARIAPFHANFIINTGNATAQDVLNLIEKVKKIVFEKTGIKLEREVRLLGTF